MLKFEEFWEALARMADISCMAPPGEEVTIFQKSLIFLIGKFFIITKT